MAPHNSGAVAALCAHRGSRGRSDKLSSESAKSILAAGVIHFQSQVTSFSLSSFDCGLRSYCRKQRDGEGGAGIMNINELNSLVCGWSRTGRMWRWMKTKRFKLILQNGRMVWATRLSASCSPWAMAGCCSGLMQWTLALCPQGPHSLSETQPYKWSWQFGLCFAFLEAQEVDGKSGRAPQKMWQLKQDPLPPSRMNFSFGSSWHGEGIITRPPDFPAKSWLDPLLWMPGHVGWTESTERYTQALTSGTHEWDLVWK